MMDDYRWRSGFFFLVGGSARVVVRKTEARFCQNFRTLQKDILYTHHEPLVANVSRAPPIGYRPLMQAGKRESHDSENQSAWSRRWVGAISQFGHSHGSIQHLEKHACDECMGCGKDVALQSSQSNKTVRPSTYQNKATDSLDRLFDL